MKTNVTETSIEAYHNMPLAVQSERRRQVMTILIAAQKPLSCAQITERLKVRYPSANWENSKTSARINELVAACCVECHPGMLQGPRSAVNGYELTKLQRASAKAAMTRKAGRAA